MLSKELDVVMIPYELAEGMEQTKQIMESVKPGQSVGIFIGPEGGFEKEEVEQAKEAGASEITLGKRIFGQRPPGLLHYRPDVPFRKVIIFYIVEDYMERNRSRKYLDNSGTTKRMMKLAASCTQSVV